MTPTVRDIIILGGRFSPYKLPGLAARYDASDLGSITFDAANRVSAWADKGGQGRHLVQATGASQPLLLPWSGQNYAYLPGVGGNYLSTPDPGAVTGDFEFIVRCVFSNDGNYDDVASQYGSAGNRSWWLSKFNDQNLVFSCYFDGTTRSDVITFLLTAPYLGALYYYRITRVKATGVPVLYVSLDGVTWTLLSTGITTAAGTAMFHSTAALELGRLAAASPFSGNIAFAELRQGISGTPMARMDAAQAAHNATSWTSSTGEVWTLAQSGAAPAQIVGRTSLLFDGVDDFLKTAAFTLNQPETVYLVGKQVTWTNTDYLLDGGTLDKMVVYQDSATPGLNAYAGTAVGNNVNLAVGVFGIVAAVFNGAASSLKVNKTTTVIGNCGAGNAGGFTLGAQANNALYGNLQAEEVLVFAVAHDAATQLRIANFLMQKWQIP